MVMDIVIILVGFFLIWIAGTLLTRFCLRKWVNKNSGTGKAFSIFTVIYYLMFMGDYHLSSIVFNYYCSDDNLVGLHVYEQVGLPESMLLPPPENHRERSKINVTLIIDNESKLIDSDKFGKLYDYQSINRSVFFPIGPIYKIETVVKRKQDGKLLGKAVSLNNKNGWFEGLKILSTNSGARCPRYNERSAHYTLIDNVFYNK